MIFLNFTYISPKRKKATLEMAYKSIIISKLDDQMSKSWKQIAAHTFETSITKFDMLKNWLPDCSAQDRIQNPDFLFLPLCSVLVRLKMGHLNE